jgi:uncharacterized protein (DUF427 family)
VEPSGYVDRPDYRVEILRRRNRIVVHHEGGVLAETSSALLVDEQDHGLVFYFPRHDVHLERMVRTSDRSRCPFKGEASYWRLDDGTEPIAWSYEDPYPEVAGIAGHIAFYQNRVRVEIGEAVRAGVRSNHSTSKT